MLQLTVMLFTDKSNKLLTAFSVYTNGKFLFSTKTSPSTLDTLHGIRFLSMVWILEGHVMMFVTMTPAVNSLQAIERVST